MSGNFNVVMADTVDMVYSAFKGKKRITSGDVQDHPRLKIHYTVWNFAVAISYGSKEAGFHR